MEKVLFKTKRGQFKIEWHRNIGVIGVINDREDFVVCLLQLVFIYSKPEKKKTFQLWAK